MLKKHTTLIPYKTIAALIVFLFRPGFQVPGGEKTKCATLVATAQSEKPISFLTLFFIAMQTHYLINLYWCGLFADFFPLFNIINNFHAERFAI